MCLCFPGRRQSEADGKRASRRTVTMPIFSHTNKEALPTLRDMVNLSTLLTPTRDAWLRAPSPFPYPAVASGSVASSSASSASASAQKPGSRGVPAVPRINVNGSNGDPHIDVITSASPVHERTSLPSRSILLGEGNVDLNLACMAKLERAFNEIRRRRSSLVKEPAISRDQLVAWLENTQDEDPRDVERFLPKDKDRYTQGEFLEAWLMRFGWDAERPARPQDKDTSRPITNYFISSSHNTYLEGNQLASKCSPEAYRNVLSRGCRCIEIDVWNGNTMVSTSQEGRLSRGTKADHSRNLSGTSLPNVAATFGETVASVLGDRASNHSRSPSAHSKSGANPRDSASILGCDDTKAKIEAAASDSTLAARPQTKSRQPYPRDEPIVTHGWTLTTPCGFREVCVAIRETAFENNDLPIIISLEVHADHQQQEVMVSIMKQEWGDLLLDAPLDGIDQRFRVPTLDELRRKILIKVKKPPKRMDFSDRAWPLAGAASTQNDDDGDDDDFSGSDDENPSQPVLQLLTKSSPSPPSASANGAGNSPKASKVPVGLTLGALAIYTHSERFKSFDTVSKKPSHIYSIAESRILELHGTHRHELLTHNKNYFMRLFPNGARFDSSNPDPSPFWRKGVQMVSLNWQNIDEAMMLNEGMFAGERGWVLKPAGYLSFDKSHLPHADLPVSGTLTLSIAVLAGQHIWASDLEIDGSRGGRHLRPVVKCELHVEKPEGIRGSTNGSEVGSHSSDKYKLQTTTRKTDHPDWGDRGEVLEFPSASGVVEGLSFVRFKVEDDSRIGRDELLSWACIRLDRLRPGYRYIRLMDTKGRPMKDGKLLVRIMKVRR